MLDKTLPIHQPTSVAGSGAGITSASLDGLRPRPRRAGRRRGLGTVWPALGLAVGVVGLVATGCAPVPVHQQRLVAKPGMLFSESAVLRVAPALLVQIESGAAISGGGQAAGCTSCR